MNKYKQEIKEIILNYEETCHSFAFVITISEIEQIWLIVNFYFYEFTTILTCTYGIDIQSIKPNKIDAIDCIRFKKLEDLVNFLAKNKVDVNQIRAVH